MLRFGDTERKTATALSEVVDPVGFLFIGAVGDHQQKPDVVADNGVFVLQIIV